MCVETNESIASSDSQYRIGKITKGVNLCRKRQLYKKTPSIEAWWKVVILKHEIDLKSNMAADLGGMEPIKSY